MKLQDLNVRNKTVLLRVDYNVAMEDGRVAEPKKIEATIPTIKYLLEQNAKIIILSHLGRPKGWDQRFSLKPVCDALVQILERENLACIGCSLWEKDFSSRALKQCVQDLKLREILMLENLRFDSGEEKNDLNFAKTLALLGDCFIQEAFACLHRAHASTDSLGKLLPSAFGFLVAKELKVLTHLLKNPAKPFVALLGGAKVSDKIGAIENLLKRGIDKVLIGGALAYTWIAALGQSVGDSPIAKEWVEKAKAILQNPKYRSRILIRQDHKIVPAGSLENRRLMARDLRLTIDPNIPDGWEGVDIGPKTLENFKSEIKKAKTIFWNGPVGLIEVAPFDQGTAGLAQAIAQRTKEGALTVLGGGDTIYALSLAGLKESDFSHVSTGGGATLDFLAGVAQWQSSCLTNQSKVPPPFAGADVAQR